MTGPRGKKALRPAVALALTSAAALCGAELDEIRGRAHRQAARQVADAVVRIETAGGLERVEGVFTGSGPTTGLVVSSDGWIVSSAFALAKRPTGILVHAEGRPALPARVVGTDYSRMISLLKVEADGLATPKAVPKHSIRPGPTTIALGRTFRRGPPSMSVGVVSAVGRVWGKAVQTDAKTSPHNYGGPLVDLEGRVIGVIVPLDPEDESPVAGARLVRLGRRIRDTAGGRPRQPGEIAAGGPAPRTPRRPVPTRRPVRAADRRAHGLAFAGGVGGRRARRPHRRRQRPAGRSLERRAASSGEQIRRRPGPPAIRPRGPTGGRRGPTGRGAAEVPMADARRYRRGCGRRAACDEGRRGLARRRGGPRARSHPPPD